MIHFRNTGILPILAATTMGISAKEGDSPIGQFGTGLKYVIAGVLRHEGQITIHAGLDTFTFGYKIEPIRGQDFRVVTMSRNGEPAYPLGFTTNLGKHWEPWMYVRELWSNCRDEDGTHGYEKGEPIEDGTLIQVKCAAIEGAYDKLDEYILSTKPIHVGEGVEIHPGSSRFMFYRGIRVFEQVAECAYTYNLTGGVALTEDRTIASPWVTKDRYVTMLANLEDEDILRELLARKDGTGEDNLMQVIPPFWEGSFIFRTVVEEIWREAPYRLHRFVQQWADKKFGEEISGAHRPPTLVEQQKIEQALTACRDIGFDVQFPRISKKADEELLGYAKKKQIYITERCLRDGIGTIVATLIEEHLHAVDNLDDNTRRMQDRLLRTIVNLYEERVIKRPLGGGMTATEVAAKAAFDDIPL